MPTPRWSILFRRIQRDPQSVSLAGRRHPGWVGRPGRVDRPVAGRDLGPDHDAGAADLDPAGGGSLPSRAKVGFRILPPPVPAGAAFRVLPPPLPAGGALPVFPPPPPPPGAPPRLPPPLRG